MINDKKTALFLHLPHFLSMKNEVKKLHSTLSCPELKKCLALSQANNVFWREQFSYNCENLMKIENEWQKKFINICKKFLNIKHHNYYEEIQELIKPYAGLEYDTNFSPTTISDFKKHGKDILLHLLKVVAYLKLINSQNYSELDGYDYEGYNDFINIIYFFDIKKEIFNKNIRIHCFPLKEFIKYSGILKKIQIKN